jgi:DNA-binding beta-propeller fold protein YncE
LDKDGFLSQVDPDLKPLGGGGPKHNAFITAECDSVQKIPDPLVGTGSAFHPFAFQTHAPAVEAKQNSVLLLSHGRLMWFDLDTLTETVLLSNPKQRYRGVFASDKGTLVVLATPDMKVESSFVEVDKTTGKELKVTTAAKTMDGHDAVRYGNRVYVVSTANGRINVYDVASLSLQRSHELYSRHDHINTIAVGPSQMYVMLHNMGTRPSEMHVLRRNVPKSLDRYEGIGHSAHGICKYA